MTSFEKSTWLPLCKTSDLVPGSGVCALFEDRQIAIFYLPEEAPQVYGLSNWDPIGKANVLSRGIIGDIEGKLVVASPLYKQHFELATGQCLEDEENPVPVFQLRLEDDQVMIAA